MFKTSISLGVVALATASLSLAATSSTFEDLRNTASAVKNNADSIHATYGTTGYDWNADHLQAIRDETNRMGRDLTQLQETTLSSTERQALAQATPFLQAIASDTARAIQQFNAKGRPVDNNGPLFNAEVHDRIIAVEANATQAEKIFANLRSDEKRLGPLESRHSEPKSSAGDQTEAGR